MKNGFIAVYNKDSDLLILVNMISLDGMSHIDIWKRIHPGKNDFMPANIEMDLRLPVLQTNYYCHKTQLKL